MKLKIKEGQKGMVLIYTFIVMAVIGVMLSQLSGNLRLEQQLSFSLNQQTKLSNQLDNYNRQLLNDLREHIHWPLLSAEQKSSPAPEMNEEVNISAVKECNSQLQYNWDNVEGPEESKKSMLSASLLTNNGNETPSYLLTVLVCLSNTEVQFWLSELAVFQYFQDGRPKNPLQFTNCTS